jgi:hypothetical protein
MLPLARWPSGWLNGGCGVRRYSTPKTDAIALRTAATPVQIAA